MAERKVKEITATMESLTAAMQNEKQISSSAMNLAKMASKESAAIKRAIQSLGCKVHFSGCGDCTVDIERNPTEIPQNFMQSPSKREPDSTTQNDEKSDLSVSITVMADDIPTIHSVGFVNLYAHYAPEMEGAGGLTLVVLNLEVSLLVSRQTLMHLIVFLFTTVISAESENPKF